MRLQEITQLLTESRLDYLTQNYSEQVAEQMSKDQTFHSINPILFQRSSKYEDNTEVFNKFAIKWITDLMYNDPSHNGMYTQWMLIQYTKGNFLYEDSGNLLDDLTYFHVNKRAFEQKDINQYTVDQLYDAKKQIEDQADPVQSKRQEKTKLKQDAEKVVETDTILILIPKTMEAAQYYGKGTRWCTSAINNNRFDYYNKQGPLYIIIYKKTNIKFQIQFETRLIADSRDNHKNIRDYVKEFPTIYNLLKEKFNLYFPEETLSRKELISRIEKDTKILINSDSTFLVQPLSPIAYKYYYYWTSFLSDHVKNFHNYDENGSVYILINKQNNDKYILHFELKIILSLSGDGRLVSHQDINIFKFNYPEVYEYFKDEFKQSFGV